MSNTTHSRRVSLKKLKPGDIIKTYRSRSHYNWDCEIKGFSESIVLSCVPQENPNKFHIVICMNNDRKYYVKLLEIKSKQITEVTLTPRIVTSCEVCYVR